MPEETNNNETVPVREDLTELGLYLAKSYGYVRRCKKLTPSDSWRSPAGRILKEHHFSHEDEVQMLLCGIIKQLRNLSETNYLELQAQRRDEKEHLAAIDRNLEDWMVRKEASHGPCPKRVKRAIRKQIEWFFRPKHPRYYISGHEDEARVIDRWSNPNGIKKMQLGRWPLWNIGGYPAVVEYKTWMKKKAKKK